MNKIEVPDRYNYIAAFLTLRCNLGCSYCINDDSGVMRNRKEMSAGEWINSLNRLETKLPITLEGGEPTMHPEFHKIIVGIDNNVGLLTNLQFNTDEFISRVNPRWFGQRDIPGYKSIRASFHPEKMSIDQTVRSALRLQNAGFNIGLFSLNVPENLEANMHMAEEARKHQLYFFIKDFLGIRDGKMFGHFKYPEAVDGIGRGKFVQCRTSELLIAPDGGTYNCHRDLYHAEHPIGNIKQNDYKVEDIYRLCNRFGDCNPCDIKLKTNRFLQMGACAMEIKDE